MQERIGPAPFLERPRAAGEFITQLAKPVQQALMQRTVLLCRLAGFERQDGVATVHLVMVDAQVRPVAPDFSEQGVSREPGV